MTEQKKCRWWVATNFNMNNDEVYEKFKNKIAYMCWGNEICPTTNKKHQQTTIYFVNGIQSIKNVAKMFIIKKGDKQTHVEKIYKAPEANINYCSKDGDFHERGKRPEQGKRTDLDEIKEDILKGKKVDDIVLENPMLYHQYGRTLNKIEEIYLRKQYRQEMTKGIWYYGETGVGKSHKAFENFTPETHFVKNLNEEFWDGYTGQEVVIFNEFRGQYRFSEILDLLDKYPKTVKIKGKAPIPFISKLIIFTSCNRPEDIYINCNEKMDQLYRRLDIIEIKK